MTQRRFVVAMVAAALIGLPACGANRVGSQQPFGTPTTPPATPPTSPPAENPAVGIGSPPPAPAPAPSQRPADRAQPAGPAKRPGAVGPYGSRTMTGSRRVALTFDDGPHPEWTPRVLDMLRRHNVKATFCLVGTEAARYPELVRAIARGGHSFCNHTWNHDFNLGRLSPATIRHDLERTNAVIRAAVPGAKIRFFRHPGGNWTRRAIAVASALGMRSIHWDVDPQDWRRPPASHIAGTVIRATRPGSIVLLHDAGGERENTYAALRTILPNLRSRFTLAAM